MNVTVLDDEEANAVPADVVDYFGLDLTLNGEAAQDLNGRLDYEATLVNFPLTDIRGAQPSHLTQGMSTWYGLFVAPKRGLALAAIAKLFKERSDRAHGEGFLLQAKLAALEETYMANKERCYRQHSDKYYVDSKKVEQLQTKIVQNTYEYDVKKARFGREAKVLNRWLYLSVLFFVVFGSEAALNFESFSALPWATPAIAWGATVIIGLAIRLASHYHGTVFKQYGYWFGADQDDHKRGPAWRMVIGGAAALTVSLSFIYYARSAYLVAYLGSVSGFGQGDSGVSTLWVIGGSLLGNMIVYLVGVLWAYLLHDNDPDFEERKRQIDKDTAEADKLRRKLEHLRQREIEQLNAAHKRNLDEAQRAFERLIAQPSLAGALELFKKFQSKDAAVVALLQNYRGNLIKRLGPAAQKAAFVKCCDDPHVDKQPITAGDYQQIQFRLKYLEAD